MGLFISPPVEVFNNPNGAVYWGKTKSYAYYNYLRPGFLQKLKRSRFETALALARHYSSGGRVLDFGCADGVFLPSLSRYFSEVVGVDVSEHYLSFARTLIKDVPLSNVSIVCNNEMSFAELQGMVGRRFELAFVLETMEHVGSLPDMYGSKMDFLDGVFSLLDEDAIIIASVPRMVGVRYLIKHSIQVACRLPTEAVSLGDLMRASFLCDTSRLEPKWNHTHIGFNHLLFGNALRSRFNVIKCVGTLTSVFYVIGRRRDVA